MTYTFCWNLKNVTLTYNIKQIKKMRYKYCLGATASLWLYLMHRFIIRLFSYIHIPAIPDTCMQVTIEEQLNKYVWKLRLQNFIKNCSAIFVIGTLAFENNNKAKSCHPMTIGTEENIPLQFFFQAKWFWILICLNFLVHLQGSLLITIL